MRKLVIMGIWILLIAACAPLSLFPTPTFTAAFTPTPTATWTPTVAPTPTATPTSALTTYVVQPGDTLAHIAARYETTAEAICVFNALSNCSLIHPGQELLIPPEGFAVTMSTPSPTAVPFTVSITPAAQTLPAGASASFFASVPQWTSSWPGVRWSVAGLPSGVTAEFLRDAVPAKAQLVLSTSCTTPPGSYVFDLQATVAETTQAAKVTLNVGERLSESQPGSFAGSFKINAIRIRRGGPSTEKYGPFLLLAFCDSTPPRKLRVTIQTVTSDAGKPMPEPPGFSLFSSLVWPAPSWLQTDSVNGATAKDVAKSTGWILDWSISGGVYILAFERSPLDDALPPENRPAAVTYGVEIVP